MKGSHRPHGDRSETPEAPSPFPAIHSTVAGNRRGVGPVRTVRAAKRCGGHFTHEIHHVEWNDRSRVGTTFPPYR